MKCMYLYSNCGYGCMRMFSRKAKFDSLQHCPQRHELILLFTGKQAGRLTTSRHYGG